MMPTKLHMVVLLTVIVTVGAFLSGCGKKSSTVSEKDVMDWHFFRGDAALSGYTDLTLPKEPKLLWSYKSFTRTVSSPIVDNGTTYWCDRKGKIRGVDINGNLSFEYDLATTVEASPIISDGNLYIGTIDGRMAAVSLAKKDTLWVFHAEGQISASPNWVEFKGKKALVFGSYDNYLYCIDSETGKEISRFESGYYINGAVALWNRDVLFGGCDSWLRVIDSKNGEQTDSLLLDSYVPASPAVFENTAYIGDYSGDVYELTLNDGKITSSKKIMKGSEDVSLVSVPSITKSAVYILSDDHHLYSINRQTGKINWKFLVKGNTGESSPVVCGDKIITCTKTGIVSIVSADKGELVWEYDTGEQIMGSPAVIKDHFFILTTKGTLLCFGNK
jgi:outer membrane protein assembly factor BamB